MATRPKAKENISKDPQAASYYNVVENRIHEIKAEMESDKKKK